jgi:O-antigen/teichoic acid export membrane protein
VGAPVKPVLWLMSGRLLGFGVTFFIPVLLVRTFDPTVFGTYKQLFLIYGTLYGILQLGMAESLFYFLPSESAKSGRYVFNSMLTMGLVGLACLGWLTIAGAGISGWMNNPELSDYITPLGLYLTFTLVSVVLEIVMVSRQQYVRASFTYAFSDLLRTVFLIVPALWFESLEGLLIGGVAFAFIRLSGAICYIRHEFKTGLRPDAASLKRQLSYALPFEMAVLIQSLQSNLHQYAVSYAFDAATFAIYAVGCLQIPLVEFMTTSSGNVMMVRMGERIRDGRPETVPAIWHDTLRKLSLIFFPVVGMLLVSARELILLLFTENYLASVPIFMIGSSSLLLSVLLTDAVLRVYAETRFLLLLNMIRLLVMAVLIPGALAVFELPGAALVTLLSAVVAHGLALVRIKGLMKVGFARFLPYRSLSMIFSAASAACLLTWSVKLKLDLPTLPLLVTAGLVYTATYLSLLFRFGLLSEKERLAVTGWLQRLSLGPAKAGKAVLKG